MLSLLCSGCAYALRAPRLTSAAPPLRRPYCCDGWSTLDEASWVIEDVEEEDDEESLAARAWEEESTLGSAAPLVRRTAPAAAAAALRDDGVVCVGPALGAATAAALRAEVLTQLEAARACEAGAGPLSSVLTASASAAAAITRWDLRLRVTAPVAAGLRELLSAPAVASSLLDAAGREAELWELAALEGVLFSTAVALQHEGPGYVAASADSAACGLLDAGEAALYDGRVLHCGGPNSSPERRVQFYATFRRAAADGAGLGNEAALSPLGTAAHSLLDEYRGKHTLGRLLDEAEAWAEGGERKS
ncbi:hypothetical protein EMIHUDRAFT_98776 [Emiliania huxleyi CCMP1516]|uniref:Uncharacterized protein n=2 Tax=Emiliania huxleyi TaxID=2903 RepID=A0A0D3KBD8_EMIH1|nr:hypothetical protein EMIHUDRAFT_98776 [Emiliania huxleyi CCMP1516]EOD33073.1 hypothetical protein EMIHUDRAFT_98776 [Emiliania huxleyi CCMP1516]|eukprot:XP_005785502.1 hypothetical protein EMIHUDRAFT_98776 [Emiliania huxleyi CCMP1516]